MSDRGLLLGRAGIDDRSTPLGFLPSTQVAAGAGDLIRYNGDGHLLTVAATDAGKTSGAVVCNARTYPGQLIVLDVKGEAYAFCRAESDKNPRVAPPLKRTDCSPVSDGAAALVLRNDDLGPPLQKAVKLLACSQVNDLRPMSERDMTGFEAGERAWAAAFKTAGITLQDLSFVETHDCFTIAELIEHETMGLAAPGRGWRAVVEGWTARDGRLPVNRSGELKSKRHRVGATGVSMHVMAAMQLSGEAGALQLPQADFGAVNNMGDSTVANDRCGPWRYRKAVEFAD